MKYRPRLLISPVYNTATNNSGIQISVKAVNLRYKNMRKGIVTTWAKNSTENKDRYLVYV